MQTIDFLQQVLPEDGLYCIVGISADEQISQFFFETIEEAEAKAKALMQQKQNAFFGCSTFKEFGDRTKANVKEVKSLWVDIDCGWNPKKNKYKDYETKEQGLVALRTFVDTLNLPKPTVVDSGNGIHAYWTFTAPVDVALWKPVAEGLKFLCVKHGFKVDGACTADAARILRVPDTKNYKDPTNPVSVKVLIEGAPTPFEKLVDVIPVIAEQEVHVKPRRQMDEATKAIMGNHTSNFKKILTKCLKGEGCNQLAYAAQNQRSIDEPLWRSALSIAVFCEDGEQAIHMISKHHPEYSFARTEAKANLIPKPHRCEQFEAINPAGCEGCVHKGQITTPIVLGMGIAKAAASDNVVEAKSEALQEVMTYVIPELPYPYFRGKNGGIYMGGADEDAKATMIYHNDFYLVSHLADSHTGLNAWFRLHLPVDGIREFIAPVSSLMSPDKAREILVSKGIVATGKRMQKIIEYMAAAINFNQKTQSEEKVYRRFGWNETKSKILIGNREISAFGTKYVPVADTVSDLTKLLTKQGSYEEWQSAINTYARPGMEIRAYGFFCAFGSLLMPFLDKASAVVNLYHKESGQGKTTIIQAMTSVFGNPGEDAGLLQVWGDTQNAIVNRLGFMGNIPQGIDEVTNVRSDQLHEFLKFSTTGRGKNRMANGVNAERRNDTQFKLINVMTGNTDFRTVIFNENAVASGEMMRFIQLEVAPDNTLSKVEADRIFGKLLHNYGHAGEIYCKYLIDNLDEVVKSLHALHEKIDTELGLTGPERFISATHAAVFMGATVASKLGIHSIPIKPVYKEIARQVGLSRQDIKQRNFDAISALSDFINANIGAALVINSTLDARSGLEQAPIKNPNYEIKYRIEPDISTLYIPVQVLKDYAAERKVEYNDFMAGLKKANIVKHTSESKCLTKGTAVKSLQTRCVWLDISGFEELKPENFVDHVE